MTPSVKLVFFGTGAFGLPSLEALRKIEIPILSVVTFPDKPSGRNLRPAPSPVKKWALDHSLPVVEFSASNEKQIFEHVSRLEPDLVVVISFGRILRKEFLDIPRTAALNVHASLLPRWRGASPMQSAILAGDTESGVTIMRMVERLDAGDMLLSKKIPLDPRETLLTLEPKLSALGAGALVEAIRQLETGSARWTPQDEKRANICVKIRKEDGRLLWSEDAESLDRRLRAFISWPGAFVFFRGKRILLKKTRVRAGGAGAKPGTVLESGAAGIVVACGKGALALEELQMEGRNSMSASDFLRGNPIASGEAFE